MLFEVLKYDVFGDGTFGCREIPASPEPTAPITPAQFWELPLDLVGRTPLHPAHQIGNRELRRHRHEHMDMVARKNTAQDFDIVLPTHLPTDVSHAQAHRTPQYLEPVLGGPDEMIPVVVYAMATGGVVHGHTLNNKHSWCTIDHTRCCQIASVPFRKLMLDHVMYVQGCQARSQPRGNARYPADFVQPIATVVKLVPEPGIVALYSPQNGGRALG